LAITAVLSKYPWLNRPLRGVWALLHRPTAPSFKR
jgi:hypothetical protein